MTPTLVDLHPPLADFQAEALHGLQQPQKSVSPKFLYDQKGSQLFDQICEVEEYYLTRSEVSILKTYASELGQLIGDGVLIEFGSGSSHKVRLLLDELPYLKAYVGLDISKEHLLEACTRLSQSYPHLPVYAVCADYSQPLVLPEDLKFTHNHKVGFFPGSSIGNFEPEQALSFLRNAATLLRPHGGLLVGCDLKKDPAILVPAYSDASGFTAAFAMNLLSRMNRELKADFQLDQFNYHVVYNDAIGRIEMGLISLQDQTVSISEKPLQVHFTAGEILRTEYSYKYSIDDFQALAQAAGFETKAVWMDQQERFSLHYLTL